MCIAAPGKVIEIKGRRAIVEYPDGQIRQAFIADIKPRVGASVLVQMGIIVEEISTSQAKQASRAWS